MDLKIQIKTYHHMALIDAKRIAKKLRCSTRTVFRMNASGRMPPSIKIGVLLRWPTPAIDAWIAGGCASPMQQNEKKGKSQ